MKYLAAIGLLLLLAYEANAKVIELSTPEQVKLELAKPGPMILMYSADWCGACTAAKPAYKQASNEMKNVRFYIMNSDKIALKEHKGLFDYIPFFVVGTSESNLRNNPCKETDDLKRTAAGFKSFINSCLRK